MPGGTSEPADISINATKTETSFEAQLPDGRKFRGTGQFVEPHTTEEGPGIAYAAMTEPVSFVKMAIEKLHSVLVGKGDQYAGTNEFRNFEFQAMVAGTDMRQVFRGAIAQKLAREERQTEMGYDVDDTILDIAGYAVLWFAYDIMRRNYV